ncbi:hypothetical protein [Arthrobacter sp. UYCo732]|uniref:hypothetical protein n=1 Tax=Arthrobacter sp. UYCo732 TaxID=3156336 RepID=UPI00339A3A8D
MTTPNRVEKGIPAGGQFAASAHAEPDVSLDFDRGERAPVADMGPEQIRAWVAGQAQHHLSPVIGWLRRDAANGKDTSSHVTSFKDRVDRLANDVAERFSATPPGLQQRGDATNVASEAIHTHLKPLFNDLAAAADDDSRLTAIRWRMGAEAAADEIAKKVTAPAPVLDGFTAADVEDHLAREQHERQCACELKDDICSTQEYGEHWRHRMGVPDVEGIFDSIKEMAAARKTKSTAEGAS